MTEWKEVLINDYATIGTIIAEHEKTLKDDEVLNTLKKQRDKIEDEILEHSRTLTNLIHEAEMKRVSIKEQLTKKWDIEDKTFKCDTGLATLRTTKSLIVTDKMALVDRLAEILNNKQKAFDCIRSFDLTTIRKYMDVDLIAGHIAHYDEKHSMVIKGGDR